MLNNVSEFLISVFNFLRSGTFLLCFSHLLLCTLKKILVRLKASESLQ